MDSEQIALLDALIESARLLGVTQAKKGFGCYTQDDSRFEVVMHQDIASKRRALEQREAVPVGYVRQSGGSLIGELDAAKVSAGAMLYATPPRDVPEGFVVVPRVPTKGMLDAICAQADTYPQAAADYAAMIAAAPSGEVG